MYRFGMFELDADRLELTRDGRPVRLQPQPAHVLLTLVANAGRTVTRDELRQVVWKDETFVDFDRGLNFCIAQVRAALGDDAVSPRYIRTAPRRGYEFIAPVERTQDLDRARQPRQRRAGPAPRRWRAALAAALIAALGAIVAYRTVRHQERPPIVAVVRFDNETGDPSLSRFSDTLSDTVVAQLTTTAGGRFGVIGNAAILRLPRAERDLRVIASTLDAGFIVLGQVQRDAERVRVLAHLIRMPEQTHLTVSRIEDIGEPTLNAADAIASTIARAFDRTLREPAARDSRVAASR